MMATKIIPPAEGAYAYPLLIKQLLLSGVRYEPGREIVYADKLRYSYQTLNQRIRRLANALTAAGVKAGDTVALLDWDSHRYLECFFAVPMIGAVLHTHSVCATVLTMAQPNVDTLVLRGYELLKAFNSVQTHNTELHIPIFENTQDMVELSQRVEKRMQREGVGVAYLIRGHGLYTWAEDLAACMRHLEALEFLLDCEWRRYSARP